LRRVAGSLWERARERLTTRSGAPDPLHRQYTTLVVIVVVAATAAGWTLKLQSPAIIAGLTAVFALVAAGGQSLRSDLRRFGWFSPALVLVIASGPMLAPFPVATGVLVAIVVFGSGLLPALG
jgi:hypothetical protein